MTPPGHPERMERAHVFDTVAARWRERGGRTMDPRPATAGELARVHGSQYLDRVAATAGKAVMLDADTFTSPESHEVALLAAGAAVQAAEHALDRGEPAFALVRPPGHHAERDRAMGFCLYNNVAVAAAAARARGVDRVAIVDIDVHHGNGTQWMFYDDPSVLYVSTHQHPFYPGTGAADEVGYDDGAGYTVNLPLEAGATDADYALVYREAVVPVLERFAPQLLLVSAGYDAHERDPLASMRVTTDGYAQVVRELVRVGERHGAIAFVTEGGYELTALAACLDASFSVIGHLDEEEPRAPAIETNAAAQEGAIATVVASPASIAPRGMRALQAMRDAQSAYWRGI